jgi:enolase
MTIFIADLRAHQIFDSRGNPTLSCTVHLSDGRHTAASVPSGASVGSFEALEKRDGNANDFAGKSVREAVAFITNEIRERSVGLPVDFARVDQLLCALDGTDNKQRLGANTTLAVSMAMCRAQALVENKSLWRFLADHTQSKSACPAVMANVINGGAHADNGVPVQEIMVVPHRETSMENQVAQVFWVQRELRKMLVQKGESVLVGDEGGVAPRLTFESQDRVRVLLDMVVASLRKVPTALGEKPTIALDIAASEFYDEKSSSYNLNHFLSDTDDFLSSGDMVDWVVQLCCDYGISSVEDGLFEDNWESWQKLTAKLGDTTQLVGDDLFVSHEERLRRGIAEKAANAILIKPNQRGTISEILRTIALAQQSGFGVVVSHRSGETCDPFIADLAVGVGAEYIKLGALCRGERVAKYNRLLMIADELLLDQA